MRYDDNNATAAKYLKQAVPLMVDKKIPTNPINYTLWYNYVANHIPLLTRTLENIVSTTGSVSPDQSYELFLQYIIQDELKEQNQDLQSITRVASHILKHLSDSVEDSEKFDQQLESQLQQLESAASLDDVTQIIDQVMSTTRGIRDSNSEFKGSLQQANAKINRLNARLEEAEKQIYTDQLTQISNRYAFDRKLSELLGPGNEVEDVFLILIDLDHFKSINDQHGHVAGDQVLQAMGHLLREHCKGNVYAARYGGEEFSILIKDGTPQLAGEVAENIRKRLTQVSVNINNSIKVLDKLSASFGVARYIANEPAEDFIHRADIALYRAKDKGRNRVEIYKD